MGMYPSFSYGLCLWAMFWAIHILATTIRNRNIRTTNKYDLRCKDVKWKPPIVGLFKINTDAAVDEFNGRASIGVIIRDCHGLVMASCAQGFKASYSPPIAEALAILRGLRLIIDSRLVPVRLESDAKSIVNIVLANFATLSEIRIVIEEILSLL
ncbi:hypothetical protein ACOSP7_013604 [Xanthoceras sorbifolium]